MTVVVTEDFVSDAYFVVRAEALSPMHLKCEVDLNPADFPPFGFWQHRKERPSAWGGVRSPASASARKMRSAVLGAIALLPHPRERYQFSGRKMFGGSGVRDERCGDLLVR